MSALGDPSDKVAGLDQFQPTLTKRGGKGAVTFEGVEYSRFEWVMRSARLGQTLHAGEGQLLVERIDELEALVRGPYVPIESGCVVAEWQKACEDVRSICAGLQAGL